MKRAIVVILAVTVCCAIVLPVLAGAESADTRTLFHAGYYDYRSIGSPGASSYRGWVPPIGPMDFMGFPTF